MSDDKQTITDAEIDAFDAKAREGFEHILKITQALREARKKEEDPQPGSPEAEAAVKDAIKQYHVSHSGAGYVWRRRE